MNPFKGMQYREARADFPSWKQEPVYGEWKDVPDDPGMVYGTGVVFRPTPKYSYDVLIGITRASNLTLDQAMAKVAKAAKEGYAVKLEAGKLTTVADISQRKIQYRVLHEGQLWADDPWQDLTQFLSGTKFSHPVKFRIRPDFYFSVTLPAGVRDVELTDEIALKRHIDGLIANGVFDFSVKKVMYDK